MFKLNYKKGAFDSQPQVIMFTNCLPMVGGSLRGLRLLPPLHCKSGHHDIAEILLILYKTNILRITNNNNMITLKYK